MNNKYLAIDIGASSGRAIIIEKQLNKIKIDESYRFYHETYLKDGKLFSDFENIMNEVINAIQISFTEHPDLKSIGIDTWGVDYGLLDGNGRLIQDPRSYRDYKFITAAENFHQLHSFENLYYKTGIQKLSFNTIYQLYNDVVYENNLASKASHILLLPNLIGYMLTGKAKTEITNASTTSLLDVESKKWIKDYDVLKPLLKKFPELVEPGTLLGYLKNIENVPSLPVINVASHDTASAFASVRLEPNQALLNLGTWGLIGKTIPEPKLNSLALEYNFTNELGVRNQIRLLKNVMGMWIVNEIIKEFEQNGVKLSYFDIENLVISTEPIIAFIDPDDEPFHQPGQMISKVKNYLIKTKQKVPNDDKKLFRIIYESLVFKYRYTIECLEKVIKKPIDSLVIVGGGIQSKLLNQMIADYTRRDVYVGQKEATVLGNGLLQMLYFKDIKTLKSGTTLIRQTFSKDEYKPNEYPKIAQAYTQFKKIIKKGQ